VGEKHDVEFGGSDATGFRERVARNDVTRFGGGAQDHGGVEFEFAFNGIFDTGREDTKNPTLGKICQGLIG